MKNRMLIKFDSVSENEGFASKEAEQIYDEVFFFTDAKTLKLPDDELITELKEDNPEWFN